jgi:ElaB/YqjD/DUF883 family membrane-anchored ribosome-binding protein
LFAQSLSPENSMESATQSPSRSSSFTAASRTERLIADFQTFVGDVEQLLKSAAQLPGDGLAATRSKLEEKVSQAKVRLADTGSAAVNAAGRARDMGEDYMRERPWSVLGAAVVLGAVVGMLLSRRS